MKIINNTDVTLFFDDINLILPCFKNKKPIYVSDVDVNSCSLLKAYIKSGQVLIQEADEHSVVYKEIINSQNKKESFSDIQKSSSNIQKESSSKKEVTIKGDEKESEKDSFFAENSPSPLHYDKQKKSSNMQRKSSKEEVVIKESNNKSKKDSFFAENSPSNVHIDNKKKKKYDNKSSILKAQNDKVFDLSYTGPCFREDVTILTSEGTKYIKDVKVGDYVLTHKRRWRKVTEVFKTEYNEKLCHLKFVNSDFKLYSTIDHPFFNENEENIPASSVINHKVLCPKPTFSFNEKFLFLANYFQIDYDEESSGIHSFLKIDDDFLFLCSRMLLFAYEKNESIVFTFDKKEDVEKTSNAIKNVFGNIDVFNDKRSTKRIFVNSNIFNNFYNHFFHYGDGYKKLPSFLFFKNKKMIYNFIKHYSFDRIFDNKRYIRLYNKSKILIFDLKALFNSLDVHSKIHFVKNNKIAILFKPTQEMKDLGVFKEDQDYIPRRYKFNGTEYLSDCVLSKPSDFKIDGCKTKFVYNLEVEEDHSYTADLHAVHNCYDAGGYAKMNRYYAKGLADKDDVNLNLDPVNSRRDMDKNTMEDIVELEKTSISEDAIRIYGQTAGTYRWGGYKILYTMMETEQVHSEYIEKCNLADEVWLPSKWCIEKFLESGLQTKYTYMPIGVDQNIYKEMDECLNFNNQLNDFVFISVFGWSLRKGYDIMIRAFLEEFSSQENVSYLICSRYAGSNDESKKKVVRDDINKIINKVGKENRPNIVYFGDVLPEDKMGLLYNSANCYVGISRGEGFGLPFCEASLCGLPIIGPNYSGPTDFLSNDNSFLVDPEGTEVNEGCRWITYYYDNMEMAKYGEDAVKQTREHMRSVFNNYKEAKDKNKNLQNFIKENYDWQKCVDKAYDRIKEIYSNLKMPEKKRILL